MGLITCNRHGNKQLLKDTQMMNEAMKGGHLLGPTLVSLLEVPYLIGVPPFIKMIVTLFIVVPNISA